jgi:hypothetical protein|tara:strand:- start:515 stop:760 length:246 start_codon:yes stop_codon:yes gene_type:complete
MIFGYEKEKNDYSVGGFKIAYTANIAHIPPKTANGHSEVMYALNVSNPSPMAISIKYIFDRLEINPLLSLEKAIKTIIIPK